MNWYIAALKKYVDFKGRARRKEYWMFLLISTLISIVFNIIDGVLKDFGAFSIIYALAVFLPGFGLAIRRLHDIDRSGWWSLIVLLPIIGIIISLIFSCTEGTRGENRFGPDPKALDVIL